MALPDNFAQAFAEIEKYGILGEDSDKIHSRLELELQEVATAKGVHAKDLGMLDWASDLIHEFEAAIHQEICDPEKGQLKDEYLRLIDKGLTQDGVAAVASVVLKVVAAVNPAFVVSTVGIYLAVWLLKVGLNYWCKMPVK